MEVGDALKDLNLTVDEIDRFAKAFKDEKFKEMLRDYAEEISDPENRKMYEEEIRRLEQHRGNSVEFIHPEPFRAIKTSLNGKQKCFINICANEKVGKPGFQRDVSKDGRRGQCWSLPHFLQPGRQDADPKGNKIVIYDVIFHPDTLHIANKNKAFLDMVDSTAIQGIQDAFKVTLDKNNVREMRTKYKGTPCPTVIRKPIPGYEAKQPSEQPDPLAFPYPDEKRPATPPEKKPTTKNSSDAKPQSSPIQSEKTKEPTTPNYTVKYRSFIDLQDFRCSRDSAQSPRPKQIVVTIDVPLLKSATDTSLEIKEKSLLLESKKPAYRLELPLAYPVDEDKGEAKFNKNRGQLTVTLPVLPPSLALDFFVGPATTVSDFQSASDGESQEEKSGVKEEESDGKKREQEQQTGVEQKEKEEEQIDEWDFKQEARVEEGEEGEQRRERGKSDEEEKAKWKELEGKGNESVEEERVDVQKSDKTPEGGEQEQVNKKEAGLLTVQEKQDEDEELSEHDKSEEDGCDSAASDSDGTGSQCDTFVHKRDTSAVDDNLVAVDSRRAEEDVNTISSLESAPKIKPSDTQEETEQTKESVQGNVQVGTDAAFLNHTSSEESQTTAAASFTSQNNVEDRCISKRGVKSTEVPGTDEAMTSRGSEDLATDSAKQEERGDLDKDDPSTEQIFQTSGHGNKPPPVLLREIDKDGNETVISDHSTCAGFVFQNTLIYELD